MILRELIERFEKKAPVCVMVRATMENVLSAERLDALFEKAADQQENKQFDVLHGCGHHGAGRL